MVKVIALIARKPGLSREEFRRHYEEVHAPLVLRTLPGIRRYVRNHVIGAPLSEGPGFDCITEVWYDSMQDYKASMAVWGQEAGRPIREDEDTFLDRSRLALFLVEEEVST
ncbi:MAG: EthD family reductase [Chloroflexi bacterium]|nr:MAG: EthD family reductase [Chloroflexota bacterium]RLC96474.1 MAG: EthD family reductase [Chloroflexota bacterium]